MKDKYDSPEVIRNRFNNMIEDFNSEITDTIPGYNDAVEIISDVVSRQKSRPLKSPRSLSLSSGITKSAKKDRLI